MTAPAVLELAWNETRRIPAGRWSFRVAGDAVELAYEPCGDDRRPPPAQRVSFPLRDLLIRPPDVLAADWEVAASVYRALVARAGLPRHELESTVVHEGITSRIVAHASGEHFHWHETRSDGEESSGQLPIAELPRFRPLPSLSWHVFFWLRLARLADVLALRPEAVPPPQESSMRVSPTFSARYEREGRAYRTEVWVSPTAATFEVGPDDPAARPHESAGFTVPTVELLSSMGLVDTRGEPRHVLEELAAHVRRWIADRVDPAWARVASAIERRPS